MNERPTRSRSTLVAGALIMSAKARRRIGADRDQLVSLRWGSVPRDP